MNFKIGKKKLGKNCKTFIVAELSGNHNGSIRRAKKLIKLAKMAGADAVKLQTYTADTITIKSNKRDFKIKGNSPWKKYKNFWNLYKKASTHGIGTKSYLNLLRKQKLRYLQVLLMKVLWIF